MGGLILGGGYGFLSPKYGLSVDLLVECEVVTADGAVRVVSDKEGVEQDEKDLFWALRGAGQNFGAVTRFTMHAFPQSEVYCGVVVFPVEQLEKLVEFANVVIERQDEGSALTMGVTHLPHGDALVLGLMSIVFYNASEEEGRRFFAPLLEVAIADMTGLKQWPEVNALLGQVPEENKWRRLQGGATFVPPLKAETVRTAMLGEFLPFVASKPEMKQSSVLLYEILPNAKVRNVAHTATAFAARDDMYHISTVWLWEDKALDGEVREFNRRLVRLLKESGVRDGVTQ